MANNRSRSPWIIDTESATTFAPYPDNPIMVNALVWSGYTGPAATCVVSDSRGVIATFTAGDDLGPKSLTFPATPMFGLAVPQLSSGKLLVYIE